PTPHTSMACVTRDRSPTAPARGHHAGVARAVTVGGGPMEFNLADLFENAVDHFGEREYLVANGQRRTYAEMEARANQLAHHLAAQGIGPGDHVGIYGVNSVEWVESLWAVFKLRAIWININYRYVEDELAYLFGNAHLKALIHDAAFTDRVDGVADRMPDLTHRLVIGGDYEDALAGWSPDRDFAPRSGDDRYILYTGGTTGMPKGVVWRHEDVFFALGGGIDVLSGEKATRPEEMVERGKRLGFALTFLPIAPLMHGATQWAVMGQSFTGNKVVLMSQFDPHEVWRLVEAEQVNSLMITGDAMGRPLIEALDDEPSKSRDLSSLLSLSSTAAVFSPSVRDQYLGRFENLVLTDAIGSSEGGANGITVVEKGRTGMAGGPTVNPVTGTTVLGDDLRPLPPGTGAVGRVARFGHIPIGYYNDPAKTAEVFVESDGEKVLREDVVAAVKSHPAGCDALVVGVPDDRWGQKVAAMVELRPGTTATLEDIQQHCRSRIAGYKVPRALRVVDTVQR